MLWLLLKEKKREENTKQAKKIFYLFIFFSIHIKKKNVQKTAIRFNICHSC